MKSLRYLASLLALVALAACDEPSEPGRPALWEVRGPDGRGAGWLFGTIHSLPDETAWRTPLLERSLADAGLLVVEVADLDDTAAVNAAFAKRAFDRPEGPLEKRVRPELQDELANLRRQAGARDADLDAMESWAAALALARFAQAGDPANGVDRALLADFAGRSVVELEGAVAQLAIFDALPLAEQRDLLAAMIVEAARGKAEAPALAESWRRGDFAALEMATRRGILADAELRDVLLVQRNRAWARRIVALLAADARPFVAVGAAHMLGREGLPALLAEAGFTVQRIQ